MSRALPTPGGWSALASLFSDDVGAIVGAAAGRIESLFGPTRERARTGSGDVDGYSGFSRRGSYERLLLSEWLLADEAPDEFLRRAATHTHAFHAIARRKPEIERTLVVLLDAGPEQIGAPRLGQIASLVALDRRAAREAASIAWGYLTTPEAPLRTSVDEVAFRGFLAAHDDRMPMDDAARLIVDGASTGGSHSEIWLVGGSAVTRQRGVPDARRIVIEDAFDPSRRAITISVSGSSQTARRVELDLPASAVAVRMLRSPFRPAPETTSTAFARPRPSPAGEHALDVARGFHLSPTGGRLLGVSRTGDAISIGVGLTDSKKPIRPRVLPTPPGATVVAVGSLDKKFVVLAADARKLTTYERNSNSWYVEADEATIARVASTSIGRLVPHDHAWPRSTAFWDDFSLAIEHPPGGGHRIATTDERARVPHRGRPGDGNRQDGSYPVRWRDDALILERALPGPVFGADSVAIVDGADPRTRVVAASSRERLGSAIAYEDRSGRWRIVRRAFEAGTLAPCPPLELPTGSNVAGLVFYWTTPVFVLTSPRSLWVAATSPTESNSLFSATFHHDIRRVAVAASAPIVAVGLANGSVGVVDVVRRKTILTLGDEPFA